MGSYTPNYKLLKVDPDPAGANEFVDVQSQLDNNLSLVDDFANRASNYAFYDNVPLSSLSKVGNYKGDKLVTNYDHSIKVWSGTDWAATKATPATFTDVVLNSNYAANNSLLDITPGYYIDNSSVVFLRGVIQKLSYAIWAQGTVNNVCAAGSFPVPTATRTMVTMGGYSGGSGSRTAQFYLVTINLNGSLDITKYGATAQVAGNAENYVSLEGLWYVIS